VTIGPTKWRMRLLPLALSLKNAVSGLFINWDLH
jgi:hypothetical protein